MPARPRGCSYPVGGVARIAQGACQAIVGAGGAVLVRAPVVELVVANGVCTGVVVDKAGERHPIHAPVVVSCAGAWKTFNQLVPAAERHYVAPALKALSAL